MNIRLLACAAFVLTAGSTLAQAAAEKGRPEKSMVFTNGEGQFALFRAPQILVTKKGTILALAQGRYANHDQAQNKIVFKRSIDGGKTWSPLKIAADSGQDSLNSVCLVQVRETGRIIAMGGLIPHSYARTDFRHLSPAMQEYERKAGNEHVPPMRPGYDEPGIARGYVITSDDDGATWSPMIDVTRSTKPPPPHLWVMPGPGLAIQLRAGPHAGRIVVPCYSKWLDLSKSPAKYRHAPYSVYSDDRGKTWQRGEFLELGAEAGTEDSGETQLVELEDGTILLNTRSRARVTARSRDGGKTWSDVRPDEQLKVFPTAAGLLKYSSARDGEKTRILFSNPVNQGRTEGRIWLSYDDGRTWAINKVIEPRRFGYSTLARLPDNSIGCMFWDNGGVALTRFTLGWLTDGKDKG